jgi:hypothetical protein
LLRLGMAIEAVLEPLHRRPSAIVEARAGLMKSEHIMRPTHMPVTLRLPWALGDNRAYAASQKDKTAGQRDRCPGWGPTLNRMLPLTGPARSARCQPAPDPRYLDQR